MDMDDEMNAPYLKQQNGKLNMLVEHGSQHARWKDLKQSRYILKPSSLTDDRDHSVRRRGSVLLGNNYPKKNSKA